MNAVFLMFDSLNRDKLSAYGCTDVLTPNFKRFEKNVSHLITVLRGASPAFQLAGSFIPGGAISYIVHGGHWNRLTTQCQRSSKTTGY